MPESCLGNRTSRLGLLPKDTAQPGPKEKRDSSYSRMRSEQVWRKSE